jgi:DNA helicase-2/ATP-dependent DNA helicase PcrA
MKNKKSVISQLKNNLNLSTNYKQIFKDFFMSEEFVNSYRGTITENEINKFVATRTINYEDACIYIYLKGLLEGFNYRGLINEVVIDEAQDYTILQYKLIRQIFKKSNFTILGDINQTINPYYKYNSLEELKDIFNDSLYLELTKTYRSSKEIIEYTNKILDLSFVSAIRRNNNRPVLFREENNNLKEILLKDIRQAKDDGFSVAIITKTDEEAEKLYKLLKDDEKELDVILSGTKKFNKKEIIIPAYIAKGLEFDETIIYTNKNNKYKKEERYLYYVACTRCQHQLIIYNQ